jgi:hypothetical protein
LIATTRQFSTDSMLAIFPMPIELGYPVTTRWKYCFRSLA